MTSTAVAAQGDRLTEAELSVEYLAVVADKEGDMVLDIQVRMYRLLIEELRELRAARLEVPSFLRMRL